MSTILKANWIYDISTKAFSNIMHNNPIDTGKLTNNLFAIKTGTVNFYIYKNGKDVICIDSGFGKNIIIRELKGLGLNPKSVTHLFLTHSDVDHIGGVSLLENAKIFLSSDEEQMITRKKARALGVIYNSKIKRMYNLLNDNDVVDAGSIKIRAIATPGHTPGSMSYLVNESILFVGDTFKIIDNKVYCPIRQYINMDMGKQKESISKLAYLNNIEMACTAHRGFTKDFAEAICDWK